MQSIKNITAVFCTACIAAEAVSQLTGSGAARRGIKAAAGLYILAVLLGSLPKAAAQLKAFSPPAPAAADYGTFEQNILAEAASQLEASLAAECFEQTGVNAELHITLEQSSGKVRAAEVKAAVPQGSSAEDIARAAEFLRSALDIEPEISAEGGRA